MNKKIHVRKDDEVIILSGKDAGKKGKVLDTFPKEGKVLVEGINIVTKHIKPRNQYQQGGLVNQESPIYSSKVMLICNKCNKPTRVGKKYLEDGSKARVCKKCDEVIDIIGEGKV